MSINDHLAIRDAFRGLFMQGVDIKYSVSAMHGQAEVSKELVITNRDASVLDSLF